MLTRSANQRRELLLNTQPVDTVETPETMVGTPETMVGTPVGTQVGTVGTRLCFCLMNASGERQRDRCQQAGSWTPTDLAAMSVQHPPERKGRERRMDGWI